MLPDAVRYFRFKRSALSVAVCSALAAPVHALPQGGEVAAGTGAISAAGSSMTITQGSQKLIIDWQGFGIGAGESVQFLQPGANAVVLNRVLGNNASAIYGSLSANGQVFLTNPNGILFGATAQVDVGGLVASTLAIRNEDFLAGNYVFSGDDGGAINNQGRLQAADGGVIALLAPEVRNDGVIAAMAGGIALGAGTRIRLELADGLRMEVEESALEAVIENHQAVRAEGGVILLSATARQALLAGMINNTGVIEAGSVTDEGGTIRLAAGHQSLGGRIAADGGSGGGIAVEANSLNQYGSLSANGSSGAGGRIGLRADSIVQPDSARVSVNGASSGGMLQLQGRDSVFSSATLEAKGSQQGGVIDLRGDALTLAAADLVATGAAGGGHIQVGGDYQGRGWRQQASSTWINAFTTLDASATQNGNGGQVIVWSEVSTAFAGKAYALGGAQGGDGGLIEVSGKDTLRFAGSGDAGADKGQAGTLLLDPKNILITDASVPALLVIPLIDPSPAAGDAHGSGESRQLANGNILQASPDDDFAATDAGAAYLYDGSTGALLSMLTGSGAGDRVGSGLTTLATGNYLVQSPDWDNAAATDAGAVTWGSGTTGVSGVVNAGNSLVGSHTDDRIGTDSEGGNGIFLLGNGNYVVRSPDWDNGVLADAGAATWGSGSSGVSGVVSAGNSLVGSSAQDRVAGREVDYAETPIIEVGNGNYVVGSSQWDNGAAANAGAVTWGNGATGVSGVISAGNSLVGTQANDRVGGPNLFTGVSGLTPLSNGNYLVSSSDWNNGAITDAGAVTFANGNTGIAGTVSVVNSLVGSSPSDHIGNTGGLLGGNGDIVELANGNYVLVNPEWDNGAVSNAGAVTWGSGTTGITGIISAGNSLVGSQANDGVGFGGVTPLLNGNYLVSSYYWNNSAIIEAGAVTFGDGGGGTVGVVSAPNSLVGTHAGDHVGNGGITLLANGNYVVRSPDWDDGVSTDVSAVTWGSGGGSTTGAVSAGNSLVGSRSGDNLGNFGITAFNNGNYVVNSPDWDNGAAIDAGAVTFGDGSSGSKGVLEAGNSLVGTTSGDRVGSGGIQVLTNQNYVVGSPSWSNGGAANAGAATWGSDISGISGVVGGDNSLVGSSTDDRVGEGITVLSNTNYVVTSPYWDNGGATDAGAVTWGNGSAPVTGEVNDSNSIYGSTANDRVGLGGITQLANGHYVISSPEWRNGAIPGATQAGAVTWARGDEATNFDVDAGNSLVGSTAGDRVGSSGVFALANGNYVVSSVEWDNGAKVNAGAATWGNGNGGVTGEVSSTNSLVGDSADDVIGNGGITTFANGNYLVYSPEWHAGPGAPLAGAMTLVNGAVGVTGEVSAFNSLVGGQAGDRIGSGAYRELANGDVLVRSPDWQGSTGRVDVLRLVSGDFPLAGDLHFADAANVNVTLRADQVTGILDTGTNLRLQASNDITVDAPLLVENPSGDGGNLTLQAGRSVRLNADIFTDNGDLTVVANERVDRGVIAGERDAGTAQLAVRDDVVLQAGTGDIRLLVASADHAGEESLDVGSSVSLIGHRLALLNYADNGRINLNEGSRLTATSSGLALLVGATSDGVINAADGAEHALTPNGYWLAFTRSGGVLDFTLGDADGVVGSGQANE